MTEISTLENDGRTVAYIEEGEGPVALVLVAGRSLEEDLLSVVSHYLAEEAGFHVVRLGVAGDADPAAAAGDVLAVLDRVGLADAWVGGHGFGGTVARRFASEHADRVNGLALLGVEESDIPLAPAVPVLIVQAPEDDVTPPVNGERLQASIPDRSSIKVVEGAGHLFPMTHPIETGVIIEEYLDWD